MKVYDFDEASFQDPLRLVYHFPLPKWLRWFSSYCMYERSSFIVVVIVELENQLLNEANLYFYI